MPSPAGPKVLRLLGALCATAGALAWIRLAWNAVTLLDEVAPQGDQGTRLLTWGVTGTVLMVVGMVLLHTGAAHQSGGSPPESAGATATLGSTARPSDDGTSTQGG